jgi:hypothetical protein
LTSPAPLDRLDELRRAAPRRWEVPEEAWLADWLARLADVLADLGLEEGQVADVALAARGVGAPDPLYRAGWMLCEIGAHDLAVAPLARAHFLRPGNVEIVGELALALEAVGAARDAVRLYQEHVELLGDAPVLRYHYGFCAAFAGRIDLTRQMAATLPAETDPFREVRARLDGYVARHEAVARQLPLDDGDVRGWHAVLSGGVLLVRSPDEQEGMNGRFGISWEQPAQVARVLDRLALVLRLADVVPTAVVTGAERDDRVLARAVAERLALPVVDPSRPAPGERPLVVHFRWADGGSAAATGELGFAYWLPFHARHERAPAIVGLLAQRVAPPWGERMRLVGFDPGNPAQRGEVVTEPPDLRAPEVIGAELARQPADPPTGEDAADARQTELVVRALGDARPWVGLYGGTTPEYWPGGPVFSPLFL